MGLIGNAIIATGIRIRSFIEDLRKDERGVSAIIATVLILVIVVALVAIFWEQISTWFTTLWAKITGNDTVNNIGTGT